MDHGLIVQYGSPMDVYDRPRSAFVADFVGNANLFSGRVRPGSAGGVVFESADLRLELPAAPGASNRPPAGERGATLLIRPEHLRIGGESQAHGDLPGTVGFVMHLGAVTEYDVRLDQGAVMKVQTVRTAEDRGFAEGARVRVGLIAETAYRLFVDEEAPGGPAASVPRVAPGAAAVREA
jgi:ABC-type Fe3+/spermidine/putrescine transport system ATPase subunit